MVTYYNKKDMTSFGFYLLSAEREQSRKEFQREHIFKSMTDDQFEDQYASMGRYEITHGDFDIWKDAYYDFKNKYDRLKFAARIEPIQEHLDEIDLFMAEIPTWIKKDYEPYNEFLYYTKRKEYIKQFGMIPLDDPDNGLTDEQYESLVGQ